MERARAAAWLLGNPDAITTRELMQALQVETVAQIRRTLLEVLDVRQRWSLTSSRPADHVVAPKGAETALPTIGAGDIAALVRHELSPAVGWIKLAADAEISGGFAGSRTADAVRRLQLRIDGLVNLIKSRTQLTLTKVALPHALIDSWPDPRSKPKVTPDAREATIEIETDEGLFALLLSNIFQNAIDASVEATGAVSANVAWGFTDTNYWVRVTNPFLGERLSLAEVVTDGRSSKTGHQGKGLPLIRDVADRLGIVITLEGASGTASFTLTGERRFA
ncbi:MAG: ATP-binding protein [Actinomycetota bacterium]|nr:ATP-binding protein [Actinomycetota bacterium]